jgi:glycosyltransferase involved in cell wall biosynthesis
MSVIPFARPGEPVREMRQPLLSVVVPTYKRPHLLARCLVPLLDQHWLETDDYEIVVVDDGHDDATAALVASFMRPDAPRIHYLRPSHGKGPAVARNTGWRAAEAPIVAFTDDDTVPAHDWLAAGRMALLDNPDWCAAAGQVTVPRGHGRPTDNALMTIGLESAAFVTANAFVRRDALLQVDGFDERFTRAWHEDSDLQFRLEALVGPVGRACEAVVAHPVREEPWGASLRRQRNVVFDALLYKKHPQRYRSSIRPTPPWDYYAIVALSGGAALAAVAGAPRLTLAALGGAGVLIGRFAWRRLARTSREREHVVEMVCTSALIPFASVYWRIRGALRWRTAFL